LLCQLSSIKNTASPAVSSLKNFPKLPEYPEYRLLLSIGNQPGGLIRFFIVTP
jgi:hypothetical protein